MTQTRWLFLASVAVLTRVLTACASEAGGDLDNVASSGLELHVSELEEGTGRVQYVVTNRSDRSIHVLRYQTAAHENPDQLLAVYRDGVEVEYLGARILRAPPASSSYAELAPGARLVGELNLSELYAMDEDGQYEVEILPPSRAFVREPGELEVSRGVVLRVEVDGRRASAGTDVAAHAEALTISYCGEEQSYSIGWAQSEARSLAGDAAAHFSYYGPSDPRVVRWFGAQPSGSNKVADTLNHIYDRLEQDDLNYICTTLGCADAVAWTFPLASNPIYICPRFFTQPVVGGEFSQASTIIHEIAHLGPGGYTFDTTNEAYARLGEDEDAVNKAVRELAQNDPIGASWNADSYAYYAVDPPL